MTRSYVPISRREAVKRYAEGRPIAAAMTRGWFRSGTDVPVSMFFTRESLGGMSEHDALPDPWRGGCFAKPDPAVELLARLHAALAAAEDAPVNTSGDVISVDALVGAIETVGFAEVSTRHGHWFRVALGNPDLEDVLTDWHVDLTPIVLPLLEEVSA